MTQYYTAPITRIPEKNVFLAIVPGDTVLHAGQIIDLRNLSGAFEDNYQVYAGNAPLSTSSMLGIIINDGWEQLEGGRRPDGQPDYTKYEYTEGDVVCIVALEKYMRFEISFDSFVWNASPSVGTFLNTQASQYDLANDESDGIMRIEALKYLRAGGQFGGSLSGGFIPTAVCIVLDSASTGGGGGSAEASLLPLEVTNSLDVPVNMSSLIIGEDNEVTMSFVEIASKETNNIYGWRFGDGAEFITLISADGLDQLSPPQIIANGNGDVVVIQDNGVDDSGFWAAYYQLTEGSTLARAKFTVTTE